MLGCRCNGKTVRRNENILDGKCKSLSRYEATDGVWSYWCYVNPDEKCDDSHNGWSFSACNQVCPISHVVTGDEGNNVLHDNCALEDDDHWVAPAGATSSSTDGANNTNAEVIIYMGCVKKPKGFQMKNIKKEKGGTKRFTLFLSHFPEGPWEQILTDEFKEQDNFGCSDLQTFFIP